jgi:hypothetical protein
MFGRPRLLVTDSAKEFKGHAFQRGCEDYGIRIRYRDRGSVHQAVWSKGCSGSSTPFLRRSPARRVDPWRTATVIPRNGALASASPTWSGA